ncbi:MAG: NPCBM/NEW2 domain-containing protein [Actinomycetota bacterium]
MGKEIKSLTVDKALTNVDGDRDGRLRRRAPQLLTTEKVIAAHESLRATDSEATIYEAAIVVLDRATDGWPHDVERLALRFGLGLDSDQPTRLDRWEDALTLAEDFGLDVSNSTFETYITRNRLNLLDRFADLLIEPVAPDPLDERQSMTESELISGGTSPPVDASSLADRLEAPGDSVASGRDRHADSPHGADRLADALGGQPRSAVGAAAITAPLCLIAGTALRGVLGVVLMAVAVAAGVAVMIMSQRQSLRVYAATVTLIAIAGGGVLLFSVARDEQPEGAEQQSLDSSAPRAEPEATEASPPADNEPPETTSPGEEEERTPETIAAGADDAADDTESPESEAIDEESDSSSDAPGETPETDQDEPGDAEVAPVPLVVLAPISGNYFESRGNSAGTIYPASGTLDGESTGRILIASVDGFGTAKDAEVVYALDGEHEEFDIQLTYSPRSDQSGAALVTVFLDGQSVLFSEAVGPGAPTTPQRLSVAGGEQLRILVEETQGSRCVGDDLGCEIYFIVADLVPSTGLEQS